MCGLGLERAMHSDGTPHHILEQNQEMDYNNGSCAGAAALGRAAESCEQVKQVSLCQTQRTNPYQEHD